MTRTTTIAVLLFAAATLAAQPRSKPKYLWLSDYDPQQSTAMRIAPPVGFERIQVAPDSFANWLRHLPLKPGTPQVLLFDGQPKSNQTAHAAVINMDVGRRDLQQCADSIIRLRAEFLASVGRNDDIHFTFTSGDRADFTKWSAGYRPIVKGNDVQWKKSARVDSSYRSLRGYLDVVFTYAGTVSLKRDLSTVNESDPIEPGDVFVRAGSPGHAVIVIDVAARSSGKRLFLLAQGFMPAQEMHLLKNPAAPSLSPWYDADFQGELATPEWTFKRSDRKRF